MAWYTTADAMETLLGVSFTPTQTAQADAICAAVTAFIDGYTGRTWQTSSPIADEWDPVLPSLPTLWPASFGIVYLQHWPVASVTAISLRTASPNATPTVLTASQYELVDPRQGVVTLADVVVSSPSGLVAVVDYVYSDEVPADVEHAALRIASGEMARLLAVQGGSAALDAHPELAGLESISLGQGDITVKAASGISSGSLAGAGSAAGSSWVTPGSAVAAILNRYVRVVIA